MSSNDAWKTLYEYVKNDILEYEKNMKLPKFMVLRLQGLSRGQFIANKNQQPLANYEYDVILMTFKACRQDIMRYTKQNIFKDEQHKFNYIMVIIENHINDIVLRLNNVQKQNDKINIFEADHIKSDSAEYTKKTKEVKSKVLDDLW